MTEDEIENQYQKDMAAFTQWLHRDRCLAQLTPRARIDLLMYVSGLLSMMRNLRRLLYVKRGEDDEP